MHSLTSVHDALVVHVGQAARDLHKILPDGLLGHQPVVLLEGLKAKK